MTVEKVGVMLRAILKNLSSSNELVGFSLKSSVPNAMLLSNPEATKQFTIYSGN